MPPDALFFTVSGQRSTARTALCDKLKLLLPGKYPGQNFQFLGNPFEKDLPCPLLWGEYERSLLASTRVINLWGPINEASAKAKAALDEGAAVFTDGLGLDVMLYAAALVECHKQNDEAFRMHNAFVKHRLYDQNIPPPEYFITRAEVETVDAYMLRKHRGLRSIKPEDRRAFIQYEERMCGEYFDRVAKQKPPNFIDASLSVDEMADQVIRVVGERLRSRSVLAA